MNKDAVFYNLALNLQKFINFLRDAKLSNQYICDDDINAIANILTLDMIKFISWDGTEKFPDFSHLLVAHNLLNALGFELEHV